LASGSLLSRLSSGHLDLRGVSRWHARVDDSCRYSIHCIYGDRRSRGAVAVRDIRSPLVAGQLQGSIITTRCARSRVCRHPCSVSADFCRSAIARGWGLNLPGAPFSCALLLLPSLPAGGLRARPSKTFSLIPLLLPPRGLSPVRGKGPHLRYLVRTGA